MNPKKLLIILITCIVVCHGSLDENFISRIKRLHGDNQSNSEGKTESVNNDGPKSRNEELINLRIGDVTRPVSQHIPKLSNMKNIISSSIPLPVELLLRDDQKQHTELNSKSIDNLQDVEEPGKLLDNKVDSVKLAAVKRRPTKKKITKTTNNNEIMEGNISRTQARNKIENNPHNLVLENKLNNKNLDTEKIISPENYNKEHLFDEAIIPLLKILGNSLKSNELDITHSDKQQNNVEKKRKIHKLSNHLDDAKDTDVLSAERVTKILEEQNNLLKNILFKTLNYKNETNDEPKEPDERETKKIHLILDINSDAKDSENPNTTQNINNYEKILNMILYRDRDNTQKSTGDDKKENKVEELPNNLRNDTNQYVYFNNRNIKTYIYSTNTKRNQPTNNPKQWPITGIDWKRYNNMRTNQKLINRIFFVPSHEEKISVPSNYNYKLYKELKSKQQIHNAVQGINLDHKLTISKCPYHGLYSRL